MADYKILLGVMLNSNELSNVRNQIESLESNPIKLNIDTSQAQAQINNIRQQIQQLGNIGINLGGIGTGTGARMGGVQRTVNEVNQAYNDLMNLSRRIQSIRLQIAPLDSTKNSGQIRELSGQLNRLMSDYNNLYQTFNRRFSTNQIDNLNRSFDVANGKISTLNSKMSDTSAIQRQTQAFRELSAVSKEIGNLEVGIAKLKSQGGNAAQIEVLEQQLRELQVTYQHLVTTMNAPLTAGQWSSIYTQIAQTQDKLAQLDAKVIDTKAKLASGIQANFGNYDAQLLSLEGRFDRLATKTPQLEAGLNGVRQALTTLKSADGTDALIAANDQYLSSLKRVEAEIKKLEIAERNSNNTVALQQQKEALALKMSNWLRDNSSAAKQFGGEIRNLQVQLQQCGNTVGVQQVGRQFDIVTAKAKEAGVATMSFGDRFKKQLSQYSTYLSGYMLFSYAIQGLRSMFEQVKSIDSAMTELKKVTDESADSYNRFLSNAATRSKEIGTTIDGLVSSTADFARLGYSFEDSQGLAEVANIYAVVGDEIEGVEGATESLISTMAAFKSEMNGMSNTDFAMSIIDKFNEIGNNFAISSGGIGEALERSASSLMAANNTIDESIALITAAM